MKKIHLTQEQLSALFYYNSTIGTFTNKITRNPRAMIGSLVGSKNSKGYLQVQIDKKMYPIHRLMWLMETGNDPYPCQIDHKDHCRDNNAFENLRLVTQSDNNRNRSIASNNTSGVTGVYWDYGNWVAQIKFNGRTEYLGSFKEKADAIGARKDAEKQYGFHTNHGRK